MSVSEKDAPGRCIFCSQAVDSKDTDTYREVTSWVTGKKLQSPVLRTQTGRLAHPLCIKKQIEGQAVDQPDLFGEEGADEPTVIRVNDRFDEDITRALEGG